MREVAHAVTERSDAQERRRELLAILERMEVYSAAAEQYDRERDLQFWMEKLRDQIGAFRRAMEGR